ncbi:hypothetical protein AVEN_11309-1 [Araneus ventricosus]|uniref:Uncharacterized protein n=1 Tax=Araneus ventricosus TaxID=182803 RepID=A0A4Y2E0Q2_ARAVE|nr:hypothetical protein AVEN_11309-1 [Araneus ventricosus]
MKAEISSITTPRTFMTLAKKHETIAIDIKEKPKIYLSVLKLDIHHRSVPIHLQGFLADHFHLVGHSQVRLSRPHRLATRSPRLLYLLLPRFQNGSSRPGFPD